MNEIDNMDEKSTHQAGSRPTNFPTISVKSSPQPFDPCAICSSTGLAILPVRYTIVPSSLPGAGTGKLGGGRATRQDVGRAGYHHALRTLRHGILYIFYEEGGPYGAGAWEAYAVAENGTLWRQPLAEGAALIVGGVTPQCKRDSHDPLRTEYIVIKQPETCGTTWLAFSQYPWTPDVLDRYAGDSALRGERMQSIEPAVWMSGPKSSESVCALDSQDDLATILEYGLYSGSGDEPTQLPHLERPKRIANSESFDWYELKSNATRYPWSMRNDRARNADESSAALGKRFRHIRSSSYIEAESSQRIVAPMLIALWDPIGVVHELNGFRNDVIGKMAQYRDELKMKFGAAERIDQISAILQNNAAVLNARYFEDGRAAFDKMKEENGADWAEEYVPFLNSDEYWESVERNLLPILQRKATKDWEGKYKPLLDMDLLHEFKARANQFSMAGMNLVEVRSEALGRLLVDPLLHIILEDYDGNDLPAGVAFDEVVADAIESLGVDRKGQLILESLIKNTDVSSRASLIWRSIALNQSEGRGELKEALAAAEKYKEQSLAEGSTGWEAFVKITAGLKNFLSYYKNFEAAQKEVVPTTKANKILRESGIDRLVVSCGALIMKSWGMREIQDGVGGAIVRFVLKTRAFMDPADVSEIINLEARTLPEIRRYFYQRVAYYKTHHSTSGSPLMYALRDLENQKGNELLRRRWEKAADSSRHAVRLASITGILECVNFVNIIIKSDKTAKDYGSLVASGASVLSMYAGVSMAVTKEFLSEGSRSVGSMKVVGGLLGAAGTTIGVFYDVGEMGLNVNRKKYSLAILYGMKAIAGTAVAGAHFLTALSYSAPTLRSAMGGRSGVVLLEGLKAGMSAAAQDTVARAAGTAVVHADRVVATEAMKRLGVWILKLGTWEVTVVITAIQGLIWALEPGVLEKWCGQNEFAIVYKGGRFGVGATGPSFKDAEKQDQEFVKALGSIGVRNI